ncbi:MAG TPA: sigma-54 dependent transcriptional regulator [Gemmatimonadales bacterium]|nr:sigma-54 dependent transcriptional regulator [Gemmatimonadales bacterium]
MTSRILLVDDEANIRRMLGALLRAEGYTVLEAAGSEAAVAAAVEADPDTIFLDLVMPPGAGGLETLERLRIAGVDAPVIMMSGKAELTDAVRAIKLGAFQFLEKPLGPESVLATLTSALELRRTRAANQALQAALVQHDELVGESAAIQAVHRLIAQVGPADARVLITGESGTGKELVAAAIHRASPRARGPFIPVNCAAIPRDLVESEMFGHERGAFTGATERRMGRFELAEGGTLFLDEVGDLGAEAQAKLLRVLETGEVQRLGAEHVRRVDVRVLAATNHRLDEAVARGTFRQDLYFRLNVVPLELPPLRERASDIPLLAAHFAQRLRPRQPPLFNDDALQALAAYSWPGNVRELANVVERLVILAGPVIDAAAVTRALPAPVPVPASAEPEPAPLRPLAQALDDFEREYIARALREADGKIAEAARLLQTDRPNLYRRLRRLGLLPRPEADGVRSPES